MAEDLPPCTCLCHLPGYKVTHVGACCPIPDVRSVKPSAPAGPPPEGARVTAVSPRTSQIAAAIRAGKNPEDAAKG